MELFYSMDKQKEDIPFRKQYDHEKRLEVSEKIRKKYPKRLPVIVERDPNCKNALAPIAKKKFLVPQDATIGKLLYEIRKHIQLKPDQAIFLFVNGVLPQTSALISNVYQQHKDDDGFLYFVYSCENTFGTQ